MDEHERPVEVERETTVINTGGGGGGGGGAIVALVVVALLGIVAFLWFGGYLGRSGDGVDVNVNVEAPQIELPAVELPDVKVETPPPAREERSANKAE